MDHNSPGQTPLWWVIPMLMIPMIDRNKGTLSLGGVSTSLISIYRYRVFVYITYFSPYYYQTLPLLYATDYTNCVVMWGKCKETTFVSGSWLI